MNLSKHIVLWGMGVISLWTGHVNAEPVDVALYSSNEAVITAEDVFDESSVPTPSCHASTIAETTDGTLVAAWFGGKEEGNPDVGIWVSRKEKGGTWSAPVQAAVGMENGKQVPCWNPVLFQWKDGPLVLFFKVSQFIPAWHGEMLVSRDDGKTWGEREVLPEFFIGPVKNKPIQLADGSLLAGSSMEGPGDFWRVHVEHQPSFGATWSRSAALHTKAEGEAIQPALLTYPDGKIQMICRTRNGKDGHLWQIWSEDGGKTWGKMTPTILPNPNSGIDGVTLADGRQLLVYNHTNSSTGGRGLLNLAMSENGIDWSALMVLENNKNSEFSYPAVIQGKDGTVHIVYTWERKKICYRAIDPSKLAPVPMTEGVWPKQ